MVDTTSGYFVAIAGIVVFLLLTVANYRIAKSWLYPAAALSGVWLIVFLTVAIANGWLYPVSAMALVIFVVGSGYYSLGAYLALRLRGVPDKTHSLPSPEFRIDFWLLMAILVVLFAGFPFYFQMLESLTSAPPFTPTFFLQLRIAFLEQAWTQSRVPVINNLVDLSSIAALIGMWVSKGGFRWNLLLAALIGISLIYNVLTAAKIGFASLAVELTAIYAIRYGGIKKLWLLLAAGIFFVGFSVITVAREEAVNRSLIAGMQQAALTARTLLDYLTVSTVGFTVYLQHPDQIPAIRTIWFFFEHTANYFGNFFDIPRQQNAFVSVGVGLDYNTYTAYFTYYPHWGIPGVAIILFFTGFAATRAYKAALRGSFLGVLLYAYLYYGTLMTMYNESLFETLNYLVKLLFVGGLFVAARRLPRLRDTRVTQALRDYQDGPHKV